MKNVTSLCLSAVFLVSAASLSADTVFLDFGGSVGVFQESDTGNANYWNTVGISTNSTSSLVTSTNSASGITYTLTAGFNGQNSGAVSAPSTSLLGDLAVGSATNDFGYVQGSIGYSSSASFTLSGLDANTIYTFTFFGSRNTSTTRDAQYQVVGTDTQSAILIASGSGIAANGTNNYNDDEVVTIGNVSPNGSNEIVINVGLGPNGDGVYGYLNAIQITATSTIPEPSAFAMLAGFAGLALVGLRRRR